jgi:hypothetical protein
MMGALANEVREAIATILEAIEGFRRSCSIRKTSF